MNIHQNSVETTINLSFRSVNYIITKKLKHRIKCDVKRGQRRVAKEKAIKEADILSSIEEKLRKVFNN